uniref:Gypsy retrotransposon integrase-like protein 1 n=1 Tax=Cajanus cajan TaxID=3821 RepID=A0A151T2Y1_CAJCA|nr:Gypsy retrotransposon integrase-like protein 1 [Cajanus cajan]
MKETERNKLIRLLHDYKDVFAWSYQDMLGLDTSIVEHKLPLKPECPPVKRKLRRMKPELSLKIKEEVKKKFDAGFLAISKYPRWVANIVPIPKKDGKVYYDIKEYIKSREYPPNASENDKRTLRRLSMSFFLNGEVLYKRNHDVVFLRCVDAVEAQQIVKEVHEGSFGIHTNEHAMARKILRAGYYWLTMENDCFKYVKKCHKCQTYADDVIGPIEPKASNGHRFILVAIDYFTKWVEVASYAHVRLKKVFEKKVHPREFREGDLVLKKILQVQKDRLGKWALNYEGPLVVKKVFSGGALIFTNMDGKDLLHPVNSDAVKKYYA